MMRDVIVLPPIICHLCIWSPVLLVDQGNQARVDSLTWRSYRSPFKKRVLSATPVWSHLVLARPMFSFCRVP